jgi:hypothetical protein
MKYAHRLPLRTVTCVLQTRMNKLEDLRPNSAVRGILQGRLVTVVNVQWYGSTANRTHVQDARWQGRERASLPRRRTESRGS